MVDTIKCFGEINTGTKLVQEIKRLIVVFAKDRYEKNDFDAIRYTTRDNWSYDIRKLLRTCYELSRVGLVKSAFVKEFGILVSYEILKNGESTIKRALIRNNGDLDDLRMAVKDVGTKISTSIFYSDNYFKLNIAERTSIRDEQKHLDEYNAAQDENNNFQQ
ncbi:hypothetical protein PVAND_004264 [Polypedilum vanderplanki]|uniref:Uncharacterized protein n=1 Tax=Polypedilum vanderplanki TaxID=319348 RepID=A0A9J6BXM1_POLVA|nr:hypothetical protein PVAND_004264 [Polypedilum vanderplanki]